MRHVEVGSDPMHRNGPKRYEKALAIAAMIVAFALLLALTGCGGPATTTTPTGQSANAGITAAKSALATRAPDAKLLLLQTVQTVTGTATPVWGYLFGSPSTDKTYLVYVANGRVMNAAEYGKSGLPKAEWALVPNTTSLPIDSGAALQKAEAAGPVKNATSWEMGLLTYLPKSEQASSTTKPLTWYVALQSGTTTTTVEVDAKTGAAKESKPK